MKITNKFNLPDVIVRAVGDQYPPQPGRVSVTALIDAPLIRYLKMKHWNELEEDVSGRLWALMGNAAHMVFEKAQGHTDLAEIKLEAWIDNMKVTGRSDLIEAGGSLIDLKVTSVYSFLLGERQSWVNQDNVYAYLAGLNGIKVERAFIYGILRDWQESKQYGNSDYPECAFFQMPIELWLPEVAKKYVEERVALHRLADQTLDDAGPPHSILCTAADKWTRPTTFAVKKIGTKRAIRVFNTDNEAQTYREMHKFGKPYMTEIRPGSNIRCERFCVCQKVCPIFTPTNGCAEESEAA